MLLKNEYLKNEHNCGIIFKTWVVGLRKISIMGGGYSYLWNNPHIGLHVIEHKYVMFISYMTSYQRWVALYMVVLPTIVSVDNMYQIKLIFVVKCEYMCYFLREL